MRGADDVVLMARFEVVRRLGEGGFGVVYEARDRHRGDTVAVKLLRREHATAVYRFKREFRSLADLEHPNLVRLYELIATADSHCLAMELVDGVDLRTHLCGSPVAVHTQTITQSLPPAASSSLHPNSDHVARDRVAIAAAFTQLARGVQALHDARKLHCDIKPSNVLAARDGRVVLLDFGLVSELDGGDDRSALGTPGYCAPETRAPAPLTFAADWYSVGAMLFEAITGRTPTPGETCVPPHRDDDLADLARLATELVSGDPGVRPYGAEVMHRLGGDVENSARRVHRLVGRDAELAALRDAWAAVVRDEKPVLVRVVGGSGIGKTALSTHFLTELGRDALVLQGRCYEHESVPYKGVDALIDALAVQLRHRDQRLAIDASDGAALARVFPVLRDLWPATPEATAESNSSQEQRRRAFRTLREIVHLVAEERPMAWFLDDVQWADADGVRLLLEILRSPGAPRVLVICGYRPEGSGEFLAGLGDSELAIAERQIDIAALSPEASRELALQLVDGDEVDASTLCREAIGNPLFLHQLAGSREHHPGSDLAGLIVERARSLDAAARQLAETVALAGSPIDEHVAMQAAMLEPEASRAASLSIRRARLVVSRGQGESTLLAPAHDRIREALVASLAIVDAREGHRRIGDALLASTTAPEPDVLAWHFEQAGDAERTRRFTLLAADRAEHALAFERAAELFRRVLELTSLESDDRATLHDRHAHALANAGRAAAAAEAHEQAAEAHARANLGELEQIHRQRAAELTLRSGRIPLGMARMDRVLRAVGITPPRSRASASVLAIVRRIRAFARGFEPRTRAPLASSARLDALFSAASGLSMPNHVLADALHLEHMREALDAGEPTHLIRALGQETVFLSVIGGAWLRKRRNAILATIDTIAGDDRYLRAWTHMALGICAWFDGDWTRSWRALDGAMTGYLGCRGVAWELAMCNAYRLPALAYLGELRMLAEIVPRAYETARDLGDLFAANTLRLGMQSLVRLAEDRPEQAVAEADAAIAPFPRDTYLGPHYHHLFAIAQAALYRGRPHEAWLAIEHAWRDLKNARFLMAQCLRVEIRHLRARAALAVAATDPKHAARMHAIALRDAKAIAKDTIPPAPPLAAAIRASVAHARGNSEPARREWERAAAGFDSAGMALHAQASRARLGDLVGGATGRGLRDTAEAWIGDQGVVRPAQMLQMVVP